MAGGTTPIFFTNLFLSMVIIWARFTEVFISRPLSLAVILKIKGKGLLMAVACGNTGRHIQRSSWDYITRCKGFTYDNMQPGTVL